MKSQQLSREQTASDFKNGILRLDWFCFLLSLLVLYLLSIFTLPSWAQALLVVGGLILPLGWMAWKSNQPLSKETAPCLQESFPTSHLGFWLIPIAAALLYRFWGITNLLVWPQADEGFSGIAGIELSRNWDWRFFYSDGQSPPVLDWICSLFFRVSDSYFFNLWFPPAIFSTLTLLLGYLAARQYFSKSFSWLFAGIIAFSFWPLYIGRLCLQAVMFPPWEMASFWALGKYLKAVPESRLKWTIVLGFVVGLGAYTYVPWVFIPALVFVVLWFEKGSVMGQKIRTLLVYAGSLVVGASWFIAACLREGYGGHISALWAGKTTFTWFHHLAVIYDYFNVVFWGFAGEVPRYVPFQGGYLNPLLGALFFLGLVEAWKFRHLPFFKVLGVAFALFILPGVLSVNVQGLRIVPLMPLPLFMVALGFQRLTKAWAVPGRVWAAVLLLGTTAVWDGYRLVQPYRDPSRYDETFRRIDKSPALYRAYLVLQHYSQESGLVFTDFTPERDQTLRGAVYPFNAAWNTLQGPDRSQWAAILAEQEDRVGLSARFPEAVWTELGPGSGNQGDLVLGVTPVTARNWDTLKAWAGVPFRYFQGLSSAMNEVKNLKTYDDTQDLFTHPPAEVTGDPFLKTCWERRTAEFYDHFGRH